MGDDVIIRVSGVGKAYVHLARPWERLMYHLAGRGRGTAAERWALRGVDMEVRRGETVGIIGRNGSGKSTLLQIVCGTLAATEGNVETHGRVGALLELGAGFNPEFTGRENVFLNGRIYGLSRAEVEARLGRIAAFAEIGEALEMPVKTYSSGMYVRLAFAVIAHVDAEVLVIDEALSVGDAFFQQKCMRFLRKFREHGTILFVSHDGAAVTNLCERAVWLEDGRVREMGEAKRVCEAYHAMIVAEARPAGSAAPVVGAESFGEGGAVITSVILQEEGGKQVSAVVGGERVMVRVVARAERRIDRPVIGFFVKDRLGQTLFGDNTHASAVKALSIDPGDHCEASFSFEMPLLLPGNYTIAAAIAEGDDKEHRMLQWVHDAAMFTSQATEHHRGLVGIPVHVEMRGANISPQSPQSPQRELQRD